MQFVTVTEVCSAVFNLCHFNYCYICLIPHWMFVHFSTVLLCNSNIDFDLYRVWLNNDKIKY